MPISIKLIHWHFRFNRIFDLLDVAAFNSYWSRFISINRYHDNLIQTIEACEKLVRTLRIKIKKFPTKKKYIFKVCNYHLIFKYLYIIRDIRNISLILHIQSLCLIRCADYYERNFTFRYIHQPNSSISIRPLRAWSRRVGQFGTPGPALKMINILWPAFHFNLANYISQDPRARYIVRTFTGGRHQLQLNRNMTKVNAPREEGRAQRANRPYVARTDQWGARTKPTAPSFLR